MCTLELKFAIYHRAVSLCSQASSEDVYIAKDCYAHQNRMASSEEAEGFLRRVLGLYTYKFLKHCAALLRMS